MLATRPLLAGDAPATVALIWLAFLDQPIQTDPPSAALRETVETISSAITDGGGACLVDGDRLVGVVLWAATDHGLYFGRLAVRPDCRRRGLARALIAAAEAEAKRRGLRRVHLSTRLPLADNRKLFADCGYIDEKLAAHAGYDAPTSVEMAKTL